MLRRNRALTPGQSPYRVSPDSVAVSGAEVTARLQDGAAAGAVPLRLTLTALADTTVRLFVVEETPLRPRYSPQYALERPPTADPAGFKVVSQTAERLHLSFGTDGQLVLSYEPFQLEVARAGTTVITVNSAGLFNFEHYRPKPQPKEAAAEAEGGEASDQEQPAADSEQPGQWEENFKTHRDSKPHGPSSVGVDVTFPGSAHVYGIPEHADNFALSDTKSGEPYRLYNLDVFEYEVGNPMALYGSVPVVLSQSATHGAAGVFWHNAAETWVDVRSEPDSGLVSTVTSYLGGSRAQASKHLHWISESGALDVFLMLGPTAADVMRQYKQLTGVTQLPPLFALGYHQCRWNYNDQRDVAEVDSQLDRHDLPFDTIWLDIEHTDGKRYFTWDSHKFPSPEEMIRNVTSRGRKMVTIIDPHIKRDNGYFVHADATANGYYVKDRDGNDFDGWCWPGSSGYLDFFNPAVQEYWASRFQLDNYKGSTLDLYTWNDMNEPSVFNGPEVTMHKDAQHHGGWEHRDLHNEYGMLVPMATARGQVARSGGTLRPFTLTRAAFAGSQRFGAKWTGDNTAQWSHLKHSLPMLLSSSVAGISFIGADIGGFFGDPDPQMLVRWYQASAFQPFMRAHAHIDTRRREPYLFGEETTRLVRAALRQRYRFLPLWYTLFYENELTGMPPMRPLFFSFPGDTSVYGTDDEYLIGEALLVHPQTEQDGRSVSVYFPGADTVWYDVDTAERFVHGTSTVSTPLDKIPVYQRSGTIVPTKERPRRASAHQASDPYTLTVALDAAWTATGTLYTDDGASFSYKDGQHIYRRLSFENNTLKSSAISGSGETAGWVERVVVLGLDKVPKSVTVTSSGREENLDFKYDKDLLRLVIRKPAVNAGADWSIVIA
ncbi:Neutral alpha-glucosidase AB [Amphibalanus amphitrite]|uniref:Glucosidase II subunit alpha n=1 Tax=Amphibalanus amphitrite TaxID=1232801 RepID=A0A6A4X048_AMPAM|nr:Neutral alpha-glucosidase AB [Amphibalanus amphitrite]KAF0308158.1 Neutral alpha-glucosidase AB [Amphibalanus amphitrite]